MKKLITILVLAAVVVFGYYAYKSLRNSTGGLTKEGIKSLIENKANETKAKMEGATDQAIQDAKDQASDALKNKVDEALGTKK